MIGKAHEARFCIIESMVRTSTHEKWRLNVPKLRGMIKHRGIKDGINVLSTFNHKGALTTVEVILRDHVGDYIKAMVETGEPLN